MTQPEDLTHLEWWTLCSEQERMIAELRARVEELTTMVMSKERDMLRLKADGGKDNVRIELLKDARVDALQAQLAAALARQEVSKDEL